MEALKALVNYILKKEQKKNVGYLTGRVGVENFILDDEPEPLPLLLVAFGPVQVAAHGGVLSVGGDLRKAVGEGRGGSEAKYSLLADEREAAFP